MTTFTRQQIDAIVPGTLVRPFINGTCGEATRVTRIHARQDDIHGKLFVCGYRAFGVDAEISFSVKEGETVGRFLEILEG